MEQRTYRGAVDPNGLADYLVNMFNQGYRSVAQKVGQGDQLLVQIGHGRHSGLRGIRNAIGVSIVRSPDGVSVSIGQSSWLNLDDPAMGGMLIGAIFFPPLLIFPLLRGVRSYALYTDIWNAIDAYCMQAGATQASSATEHGVYCPRCGVLNHEEARFCTACGDNLHATPAPAPTMASAAQVVCAECHQTVAATKFCGNCGARLIGVAD